MILGLSVTVCEPYSSFKLINIDGRHASKRHKFKYSTGVGKKVHMG